MDAQEFTYWLQGFFEISDTDKVSPKQVRIIKDHLKLVFDKQTPDRSDDLNEPNITGPNIQPFSVPYDNQPYRIQPFDPLNPNTVVCSDGENHSKINPLGSTNGLGTDKICQSFNF